jgi:N-formylglutamate deformylase
VLRRAEDAYVDRLVDFLPRRLGVPLVRADFPRSYVDPNRPADTKVAARNEVTPKHTVRIYDVEPTPTEIFNRIAQYHQPYHQAICDIRKKTKQARGYVVHLNFHSLPSQLMEGYPPFEYDIVIGTRQGKTAHPLLVERLRTLMEAKGYRVALDVPGFMGAEIVRRSGKPDKALHALQIEINRSLYLKEQTVRINKPLFDKLKKDLEDILRDFQAFCDSSAFARAAKISPAPAPKI